MNYTVDFHNTLLETPLAEERVREKVSARARCVADEHLGSPEQLGEFRFGKEWGDF